MSLVFVNMQKTKSESRKTEPYSEYVLFNQEARHAYDWGTDYKELLSDWGVSY